MFSGNIEKGFGDAKVNHYKKDKGSKPVVYEVLARRDFFVVDLKDPVKRNAQLQKSNQGEGCNKE